LINFCSLSQVVDLKEPTSSELVLLDNFQLLSTAEFIEVLRVLNSKQRASNRHLLSFLTLFWYRLKLIEIRGGKVGSELGQVHRGKSHNLVLLNGLDQFGECGWHLVGVHLLFDEGWVVEGGFALLGGHFFEVVECLQEIELILALHLRQLLWKVRVQFLFIQLDSQIEVDSRVDVWLAPLSFADGLYAGLAVLVPVFNFEQFVEGNLSPQILTLLPQANNVSSTDSFFHFSRQVALLN